MNENAENTSAMQIQEIKVGSRVRIPATEKNGGYHYARITDIVEDLFGETPIVIVKVPVLKCEKAVSPALLEPARKAKQQHNVSPINNQSL